MIKKRAYLLIGLVALMIGLFNFAPATLISQYIADKTTNIVLLTNAQGTIWEGNAELAISGEQSPIQALNHALSIGKIDWHVKASRLILGELNIAINCNNSEFATLILTPTYLSITKVNLDLPTYIVSTLVPSLNAAQLGGQLHVSTSNFSVAHLNHSNLKPNFTGQIQLDWQQASSPLSPINPLGNYQANISGVKEQIIIKVSTLNGPLMIEGDGALNLASGLQFNGIASAESSQKQALAPLLHVLGNEIIADSGRYKINYNH